MTFGQSTYIATRVDGEREEIAFEKANGLRSEWRDFRQHGTKSSFVPKRLPESCAANCTKNIVRPTTVSH